MALFVAKQDVLAPPVDTREIRDKLKPVFYKEYDNMDHGSFMFGKNMDYFKDVFEVVKSMEDSNSI